MGVRIRVDKDHIENAQQFEPTACMVHDAIEQQLQKPGMTISVGYDAVVFRLKKRQLTVRIPESIGTKIRNWDDGLKTDPFDFDLNLPEDWEERLTRPSKAAV